VPSVGYYRIRYKTIEKRNPQVSFNKQMPKQAMTLNQRNFREQNYSLETLPTKTVDFARLSGRDLDPFTKKNPHFVSQLNRKLIIPQRYKPGEFGKGHPHIRNVLLAERY
jgi:hypothetical protein